MAKKATEDAIKSDLSSLCDKLIKDCDALTLKPPTLYHYTSSSGFLGIIESGKFFASDYRYLNDENEIVYGYKIFLDELKQRAEESGSSVAREFVERAGSTGNAFDEMNRAFLVSFCSKGNLLSQWRAYGERQGAFSIGLDMKNLNPAMPYCVIDPNYYLFPVLYDALIQRAIAGEVADKFIKAIIANKRGDKISKNNNLIAACCQYFRSHIADFLLRFKHPSFKEEQEWRIACIKTEINKVKDAKYRLLSLGLTPYIELKIAERAGVNAKNMPISEIVIGPSAYSRLAAQAARGFLDSKRYTTVKIIESELPLRF